MSALVASSRAAVRGALGLCAIMLFSCGSAEPPPPKASAKPSKPSPPVERSGRRMAVDTALKQVEETTGVPITVEKSLRQLAECSRIWLSESDDTAEVIRELREQLESAGLTLVLHGDGWLLSRYEGNEPQFACFEALSVAELHARLAADIEVEGASRSVPAWTREIFFEQQKRLMPTFEHVPPTEEGEEEEPGGGYRLTLGPKDELSRALGFMDGDIVIKIADLYLDAPKPDAIRRLGFGASSVQVHVLRGGVPVSIVLNFVEKQYPGDETADGAEGAWVKTANHSIKVRESKPCHNDDDAQRDDAKLQLIGVDLEVRADRARLGRGASWLLDENGVRYASVNALTSCGTSLPSNSVDEGESKRGWVYFEGPTGSSPLRLIHWVAGDAGREIATVQLEPFAK